VEQAEFVMWIANVCLILMQTASLNLEDLLRHLRDLFLPVYRYRNTWCCCRDWSDHGFSVKDSAPNFGISQEFPVSHCLKLQSNEKPNKTLLKRPANFFFFYSSWNMEFFWS